MLGFFLVRAMSAARAAFFVDGNDYYHSLKDANLDPDQIDLQKVCDKLRQARERCYLGYYVGKLGADAPHYGLQRRYFHRLRSVGVVVVEGRIERRPVGTVLSDKVNDTLAWLAKHVSGKMPLPLYNILRQKVGGLVESYTWVEKAVDVHIAVDMIAMANRDEYDVAYLLSADGDFTPAALEVRRLGKCVFAASASHGNELRKAVDGYLRLKPEWFDDCRTSADR